MHAAALAGQFGSFDVGRSRPHSEPIEMDTRGRPVNGHRQGQLGIAHESRPFTAFLPVRADFD
jgi:hypothetical protein